MKLSCFYCGNPIVAQTSQLGGEVTCPHCAKVVRLPEAEDLTDEQDDGPDPVHSWLNDSISGLVSLVVHMCILFILAAITCNYRSGSPEGEEVMIGELPGVNLTDSGGEVLDSSDVSQDAETADLEQMLADVQPPTVASGEVGEEVSLSQLLPSGAAGGAANSLNTIGGGGGSVGAGTTFMGVRAEGSRICIIADCSGSMNGPKLEYLKEEILESISSMSRETEFQIVFFSSGAIPYNQPGWRNPKRDLDNVRRWLSTVNSQGSTYPLPAFEQAFQLSPPPEAIFFMTDGQFEADVVPGVAALNLGGSSRARIHTISFIDKSAEQQMRQIAQQSGGTYRHVAAF